MLGNPLSMSQCLGRASLHHCTLPGSHTGEQGTVRVSLLPCCVSILRGPCSQLCLALIMSFPRSLTSKWMQFRNLGILFPRCELLGPLSTLKQSCIVFGTTSTLALKPTHSRSHLTSLLKLGGQDYWLAASFSHPLFYAVVLSYRD